MYTHAINPTILHLGPLEIRWYGLMYVLAFLAVQFYAKQAIKNKKLKLTEKELDDLLGYLIVAMIIGARLFYALFYNPSYFLAQPWKFFFVWEGGLSFHGGFFAMLLTGIWFARKKKLTFFHIADIFIVPLALGNAFGRIGNFINGELYGVATALPWGVIFPGVAEPRHPTQIYEALYNVMIFAVLFSLRNKKLKQRNVPITDTKMGKISSFKNQEFLKDGTLFGLFMVLYSIFRFSVEFIKDLPAYGPLTMGQWLSIPLFICGLWLLAIRK